MTRPDSVPTPRGSGPTSQGISGRRRGGVPRTYDFRRPTKLSREHVRVLPPGAVVTVTADRRPARFVTFGERDFHRILKTKFGLLDR